MGKWAGQNLRERRSPDPPRPLSTLPRRPASAESRRRRCRTQPGIPDDSLPRCFIDPWREPSHPCCIAAECCVREFSARTIAPASAAASAPFWTSRCCAQRLPPSTTSATSPTAASIPAAAIARTWPRIPPLRLRDRSLGDRRGGPPIAHCCSREDPFDWHFRDLIQIDSIRQQEISEDRRRRHAES